MRTTRYTLPLLVWGLLAQLAPLIPSASFADRVTPIHLGPPVATKPPTLPDNAFAMPLVRQQQDYSCGPAAMSAVLQYFGVWKGREQELYKLLETSTIHGTLPENLALGARHFGLTATVEQLMTVEKLRALLAEGKTVILELQAWREPAKPQKRWRDTWADGHYVVLIGMDAEFAYCMDPSTEGAYTYLPLRELIERWHDINEVRQDPAKQRDLQLGVVIGSKSGRPANVNGTPRPATRRLVRLD